MSRDTLGLLISIASSIGFMVVFMTLVLARDAGEPWQNLVGHVLGVIVLIVVSLIALTLTQRDPQPRHPRTTSPST